MKVNLATKSAAAYRCRIIGTDKILQTGTIDFEENYPAGGVGLDFDVEKFFPNKMEGVVIETKKGYTFDYDPDSRKIKVYTAPDTEVAADTDLSGITGVQFIAVGF